MKICVFNLGCKVNQYENDVIIQQLSKQHDIVTNLEPADYYIVNTCAVTNEAEKKSRQIVARIAKLNPQAPIFMCGCAVEKNPKQFADKHNVVAVLGTVGKNNIHNLVGEHGDFVKPLDKVYEEGQSLSLRTRSYIKVQDGCNNYCSYCIIPYLRGYSRSRELCEVHKEASRLSEHSKELVLVGINLSDYRVDNKLALIDLIESLQDIHSRIRLGSLEVNVITEDFLDRLSKIANFCPHFHLSLQSGSDNVLKKMNRHYTRQEYIDKCKMIYNTFPNASITTDIIVGFPLETEEDFEDTLDIVRQVGFLSVHYFAYSSRTGTVASRYKVLPGDVIKDREHRLDAVASKSQNDYLMEHINEPLQVLVEDREGEYMVGYSSNYIKCYLPLSYKPNTLYNVRPIKIFDGGYIAELED